MNKKLLAIALTVLTLFGFASPYIPVAFAQDTTSEITNTVLQWMPIIILFAMLGMVLGMLKKFGKLD
jgi:Na+-driven multidrug efflux pump